MKILGLRDYRLILRHLFDEKRATNPSFSLRAFARWLGLSHTTLANIFSGSGGLSAMLAERVATKCGFSPDERAYFLILIELDQPKSAPIRSALLDQLRELERSHPERQYLSADSFHAYCDYDSILVYVALGLRTWNGRLDDLAVAVGRPRAELEAILEKLERFGMAKRSEAGRWKQVHLSPVVSAEVPSASLRKFHREMLLRAIDSLETQSPEEKFVGSETIALDEATYLKLRRKMSDLLDQASRDADESRSDRIYHLNVQLFRLGALPL